MHLQSGELIAQKFEILSVIGQGGMGVVYKARQVAMDRVVALKFLRVNDDPSESLARFKREAQILNTLKHRNLIASYEMGVWQEGVFVVMEYAPGRSLQQDIHEDRGIGIERTINIARQIADALQCAHAAGIVHRDLKPSNVLLLSSGGADGDVPHQKGGNADLVKVIDFGLAKIMSGFGKTVAKLTQTGFAVGSAHYMSPEQCTGMSVDARSDIYGLGCIMYQCLTGHPPFDMDETLVVMHHHINVLPAAITPQSVGEPIPPGMDSLVAKCLAKDPADRFQTAADVIRALDMVAANQGENLTVFIPAVPASAKPAVEEVSKARSPRSVKRVFAIACVVLASLTAAGVFVSSGVTKQASGVVTFYSAVEEPRVLEIATADGARSKFQFPDKWRGWVDDARHNKLGRIVKVVYSVGRLSSGAGPVIESVQEYPDSDQQQGINSAVQVVNDFLLEVTAGNGDPANVNLGPKGFVDMFRKQLIKPPYVLRMVDRNALDYSVDARYVERRSVTAFHVGAFDRKQVEVVVDGAWFTTNGHPYWLFKVSGKPWKQALIKSIELTDEAHFMNPTGTTPDK